MAVYTDLTDEELSALLALYDLGRPLSFKGIAEGVENSNFLLETETGRVRQLGGTVRKLCDCCGQIQRRINGDAALQGYCYHGRKVFCVMYFQTKVPC